MKRSRYPLYEEGLLSGEFIRNQSLGWLFGAKAHFRYLRNPKIIDGFFEASSSYALSLKLHFSEIESGFPASEFCTSILKDLFLLTNEYDGFLKKGILPLAIDSLFDQPYPHEEDDYSPILSANTKRYKQVKNICFLHSFYIRALSHILEEISPSFSAIHCRSPYDKDYFKKVSSFLGIPKLEDGKGLLQLPLISKDMVLSRDVLLRQSLCLLGTFIKMEKPKLFHFLSIPRTTYLHRIFCSHAIRILSHIGFLQNILNHVFFSLPYDSFFPSTINRGCAKLPDSAVEEFFSLEDMFSYFIPQPSGKELNKQLKRKLGLVLISPSVMLIRLDRILPSYVNIPTHLNMDKLERECSFLIAHKDRINKMYPYLGKL